MNFQNPRLPSPVAHPPSFTQEGTVDQDQLLGQRFSTLLVLSLFNIGPLVLVTPKHTIIVLLLPNCNLVLF